MKLSLVTRWARRVINEVTEKALMLPSLAISKQHAALI